MFSIPARTEAAAAALEAARADASAEDAARIDAGLMGAHYRSEQYAEALAVAERFLVAHPEHLGGELTITLLEAVGRGVEVHDMDEKLIDQSIDWLQSRQAER